MTQTVLVRGAVLAAVAFLLPWSMVHADSKRPEAQRGQAGRYELHFKDGTRYASNDSPRGEGPERSWGSGAPKGLFHKHYYRGPAVPYVKHRRGLAVIADFADTRLEDWTGAGFHSVSEVNLQLRRMEEHWAWLSGGKEDFRWDVIRVTLPVNLGPDAYPDFGSYRDAVGALIRQQVNASAYDANRDGVIDSAWVIASNHGTSYGYMVGGASRNSDVNLFVDLQNSQSVVEGRTGNFNHEVGHTLSLPDLYGPYDTLHYLTLMSDSWALPPQDFTAYERDLMGWLSPRRIEHGSHNVHLKSSRRHMQAVRIDGADPSEYFLIEYRQRPDSGFGSEAPPYHGLAVYHVLKSSAQWMDPPLLKLEAADGFIAPGAIPELTDFLFLDNLSMRRPLVLRSYFGGAEVFRIDNLYAAGPDGIGFNIQVSPRVKAPNLLSNGSFEQGTQTTVDAWQTNAWAPTSTFGIDQRRASDGHRSVTIYSPSPNDAEWVQTVSSLVPGQSYQLCGWVKGENIVTGAGAGVGANISLFGGFVSSDSLSGTFDWTRSCLTFNAESTTATVACRIGFFGSTVTGKLWCDDLTLTPLRSAFEP